MYPSYVMTRHANIITVSTSPFQTVHSYKAGGTMAISTGDIVCRLSEFGSNEYGRWAYHLTFITAYQVCAKAPTQRGKITAAIFVQHNPKSKILPVTV
jgi:hypothetical protein